MLTIWKYVLKDEKMSFRVPAPAIPLSVKMQSQPTENAGVYSELPCVWVVVDPKKPTVPVTVWIIGTGHQLPSEAANDSDLEKRYPDVYKDNETLFNALAAKKNFVGTVQTEGQPPFVWHIFWKEIPKEEEAN